MREFFKKIINYVVSVNNKQSHLLKELVFNNLNIKSQKYNLDYEKLFNLLIELKGTSLVEGLNITNSLVKVLDLEGDVCEFGVAQGKTSKLIGYIINKTEKKFFLFDSFEGLPKPTKEDELKDDIFNLKNINNYEGKMSHGEEKVLNEMKMISFPKEKLVINKGFFFKKNITNFNIPKNVSFAYLDFDFYQPTLDALNMLEKIIVKKGIIIVDDYDFFSTGVKTAVDSWIDKNKDIFTMQKIDTSLSKFVVIEKIK
jgi:O-methyltransferase